MMTNRQLFSPVRRTSSVKTSIGMLFCSLVVLAIRRLATPWTYFLRLSLSSVILTDSSTESPVHVLMLSTQAVRGLPRLRAPGIVPCIISFFRQLPCFLMLCPQYASFFAFTMFRTGEPKSSSFHVLWISLFVV